jgi:hypothetical protein
MLLFFSIRNPGSQIEEPALRNLVSITVLSTLFKAMVFQLATGIFAPCCREAGR